MGCLLYINLLYLLACGYPAAVHLFQVLNMKKLFLKIIIFILILLPLYYAIHLLLLHKDRYQYIINGTQVYTAIHKSKQKNHSSAKILLGDSVAYQLFDNIENNDPIY